MECTAGSPTKDILKQSLSLWQHCEYLHCQHSYRFLCQLYAQVVGNFSNYTPKTKHNIYISVLIIFLSLKFWNEIDHEWL